MKKLTLPAMPGRFSVQSSEEESENVQDNDYYDSTLRCIYQIGKYGSGSNKERLLDIDSD